MCAAGCVTHPKIQKHTYGSLILTQKMFVSSCSGKISTAFRNFTLRTNTYARIRLYRARSSPARHGLDYVMLFAAQDNHSGNTSTHTCLNFRTSQDAVYVHSEWLYQDNMFPSKSSSLLPAPLFLSYFL